MRKNSKLKTDEEKMLFNPYVYVTNIQRYFSLQNKYDAEDIFVKAQELDEAKGYIALYEDRVRSEAVFEVLGLDLNLAIKRYAIKHNKGEVNESY